MNSESCLVRMLFTRCMNVFRTYFIPKCNKEVGVFRLTQFNTIFNLFVTSKNETTNSPIHEFRVMQNVFKMKTQGLIFFKWQGRRKGRTLGASAPPMFGRKVNPISTRGAVYAHPILVFTPSFESHRRA